MTPRYRLPPLWRSYKCLRKSLLPSTMASWLLTPGSLSQRLQQHSTSFKVRVLSQELAKATRDELLALKAKRSRLMLIREVELICDNHVCVVARSIIPWQTLKTQQYIFKKLNTKPLIELLQTDPNLTRSEFEITQLRSTTGIIWGRRSVFKWFNNPILVAEFFLPTILQLKHQ